MATTVRARARPVACTIPSSPMVPIILLRGNEPTPVMSGQETVNRYRPGGSAGLNVRHWEIWNEPDLCQFWQGTAQEYARLLKVAYLVIKQEDPGATVMWGGLAHYEKWNFLTDLITALRNDPMAAAHNGFFDAAASHHYSDVTASYTFTQRIRDALTRSGWGSKPIWITESGVSVCNDYPGPTCPSPHRADTLGQASYIWQNIAYTRAARGGPIFHFQLHDDCGNGAPPMSPDGFGLRKNEQTSSCSPASAEARLAYTAYRVANTYLTGTEYRRALWNDMKIRHFEFYHPPTQEYRTMIWAAEQDWVARLPARSASARLVTLDGSVQDILPINGEFQINLPGPTNPAYPKVGDVQSSTNIGGRPFLLIEKGIPPRVVEVSGQVVDMHGRPAPRARVSLGSVTTFADSAGTFRLWVTEGYWDVAVEGKVVAYGRLVQPGTTLLLFVPPAQEGVTNGNFESGMHAWERGGSSPSAIEQLPDSQDHVLRLASTFVPSPGVPGEGGVMGMGGNSTIAQQVQVPAGASFLTLAYRVESAEQPRFTCAPPSNPPVYHDKFEIILYSRDQFGQFTQRHDILCEPGPTNWRYGHFDLSRFAGQSVLLHINVYETSATNRTSALVDLISIGPAAPINTRQAHLPIVVQRR
jgi:hypothetical protein